MSAYQSPGADELALLAGAAAAVAGCAARPLWKSARLVVTATHELGHALVALLLGGNVSRVHLWSDTAGLTTYSLPARTGRVRHAAVALAGYPAPGLAGVVGAWLVLAGWGRWWVAIAALVTVVLAALWVRNAWGLLSTGVAALGLGWVAISGPPLVVTAVASGLAVLLLAGGWRSTAAHFAGRERRGAVASDATVAARALYLPASVWSALFLVTATLTLVAGGWLLLTAAR
jgi:hypothetical protein